MKKVTSTKPKKTKEPEQPKISELLVAKAGLKQDVYGKTVDAFAILSHNAETLTKELSAEVNQMDQRVRVLFSRKSEFEFQLHVGGDVLVFIMHTNVFQIDPEHDLWKKSYLKKAPEKSYCGLINVYNFLHDSLFYNRDSDVGYLMGRILVNCEGHYFLDNHTTAAAEECDFTQHALDDICVRQIINDLIGFVIGFDMYLPPYKEVLELSVDELNQATLMQKFKTAKRLGFKYNSEE